MDIFSNQFNFSNLSLKDLLEARDLFHAHLINKKNVVGTAVGKYLIRKGDPWPSAKNENKPSKAKKPRTLDNSEVRDYSWPCLLVFISSWQAESELLTEGASNIVPKNIYMPDGRIVPVCIVQAAKNERSQISVNTNNIIFPKNIISGGFPLLTFAQGQTRIASLACLVSDGSKVYALTNKHVFGERGQEVFTRLNGELTKIGTSSDKQLGKIKFSEIYPGWEHKNAFINNDVCLIDIDNLNNWKTEVFGIGEIESIVNLNIYNLSLQLIGQDVKGFGAVSGLMQGEIKALFYRYKSIGGFEYISDFLIGSRDNKPLNAHHGDSGTLWLLEFDGKNYPIALHWGQHEFISDGNVAKMPYALATSLSNICTQLDVELVRDWNLDQDYSWGKTGHFKIAAFSCEMAKSTKLDKLLMANQENIGYTDDDMINKNVVKGGAGSNPEFVPLADVADLVWRTYRKLDSSNHFADMDESDESVMGGKTLLELTKKESNIDIDIWNQFYEGFEAIDTSRRPKDRGALPFRVWQMYNIMVKSLKAKKIAEFICAGGTMAHYVGDACQPLHISYLHHGSEEGEKGGHSVYETNMIDSNKKELFEKVNKLSKKVKETDLIETGKGAAKLVIELMRQTHKSLPPQDVIDSFNNNSGKGQTKAMWEDLGERTIKNFARGAYSMAVLWESAWIEGNGDKIAASELKAIPRSRLKALYNNKSFVPSYRMNDPEFKKAL